jgi:hypothetical protein
MVSSGQTNIPAPHTVTANRRTFLKQIGIGAAGIGLCPWLPVRATAEEPKYDLPRSAPEAQGVSSRGILAFLEAVAKSKHEFHSFMLLRHGQVIAEGWWSPYRPEFNHMLYSLSKSFTSTAVGLAVSEGRLTVDDAVISIFPTELPEQVSDHLRALKVKHLLTMSVGHAQDSTHTLWSEENWVRKFLSLPIANAPGSVFLYNSGATYMLSAIVQKLTGQKVIDYLTPRLFQPLGIFGMTWETCPRGINTGGWGLSARTESLAKFGQMYLRQGAWNGRQILPAPWVAEATTFKIQQPGQNLEHLKQTSDWHQGYCYQFWRCRHNAFRGDGAYGQYTIVLPEQDAVIAITSESSSMQGELDLVWEHLLPAMANNRLPDDQASQRELRQKLEVLALSPAKGSFTSPMTAQVSGKAFKIDPNDFKFQEAVFNFQNNTCLFVLRDSQREYPVRCGLEHWIVGETTLPGTPPKLTVGPTSAPWKIAASGAWKDPGTFEMTWRYCETPHHDTVTCHFEGDQVTVQFMNSLTQLSSSHPEKRAALRGRLTS